MRKYLKPTWELILCGPHTSICIDSNTELLLVVDIGNGKLVFLDNGHTTRSLTSLSLMEISFLKVVEDGCPSLLCHNMPSSSLVFICINFALDIFILLPSPTSLFNRKYKPPVSLAIPLTFPVSSCWNTQNSGKNLTEECKCLVNWETEIRLCLN